MICPRPGSVEMETICKADCPLAMGVALDKESECSVYSKAVSALDKHFGYSSFRPGQLEAILPILHGKDVFVTMATGSGKSLCMFLPPLVYGTVGVAVILSPLIGLMDEQVCFCILFGLKTGSELMLNVVVKVLRLAEHQLSAVRVSGDNKDLYRRVAVGDYQYGMRLGSNSLT